MGGGGGNEKKKEKNTRVCPVLAEVWLSLGSVPILGYFLKSVLFDRNMKINTDEIFFVLRISV